MKGVALSDLHLGFRGAGRVVDGRNQREVDVETAWAAAVEKIILERPDIVTIAGDVFHSVRPSMHAVKAWQDGIQRIAEESPAVIIVIGGNHESPRTVETLTPNLVAERDARIITEPCRLDLTVGRTGERVSVACLPFVAMQEERSFLVEPNPAADINILLIHAAVRSSLAPHALPPMYGGAAAYDVAAAEGFDIVACGDFHEFRVLSAHEPQWMWIGDSESESLEQIYDLRREGAFAFYSGSIERTSSNIWDEHLPKGFVVFDTDLQLARFVEIPTRRMLQCDLGDFDLPPGVGAEEVNRCLAQMVQAGHPTLDRDALFRFRVDAFPRSERDLIDWAAVRELRERHVHFHLDIRWADRDTREFIDRRERPNRSLADEAAAWFADDEPPVRSAAFRYLGFDLPQEVPA